MVTSALLRKIIDWCSNDARKETFPTCLALGFCTQTRYALLWRTCAARLPWDELEWLIDNKPENEQKAIEVASSRNSIASSERNASTAESNSLNYRWLPATVVTKWLFVLPTPNDCDKFMIGTMLPTREAITTAEEAFAKIKKEFWVTQFSLTIATCRVAHTNATLPWYPNGRQQPKARNSFRYGYRTFSFNGLSVCCSVYVWTSCHRVAGKTRRFRERKENKREEKKNQKKTQSEECSDWQLSR